jgi:hypothetical protein
MLTIKNNQIDIENNNLICNIEYPTIQNTSNNNLIEKQTDTPFRGVLPDQNFYITPNSIVICFSSYELYTLYSGIQGFEIKFKEIEENLSEYTKTQIMED